MNSDTSIDTQKQIMRKKLLAARHAIFPQDKKEANTMIFEKLISLHQWQDAKTVCMYISLPDEVDTHSVLEILMQWKKTVVVPRVLSGGSLSLHVVSSPNDLMPGAFGVLEPKESCPIVLPDLIDLFIIPGVAFDRHGHRLGWGKGHYDRLLQNIVAPRIALAYAIQVIAEVPCSSYDVSVSTIITEKEIIEIDS